MMGSSWNALARESEMAGMSSGVAGRMAGGIRSQHGKEHEARATTRGTGAAGPPNGCARSDRRSRTTRASTRSWTAEAYGIRRAHPARVVGRTHRAPSSSARRIVQMSARTPAATAMAAITMDHLSNGRFILGLGAVGPTGRGGLVRPAVPEAAGTHARVRRDRAPDRPPANSRSTSTASSTTCRSRAAPGSASR